MNKGLHKVRSQRTTRKTRRLRPSRWWAVLVVSGCLLAGAAVWLLGSALVGAESLKVRHIVLSGNQRVFAGQVQGIVEPLRGQPLLQLDLESIRSQLELLPGVAHAAIVRRPPDRLVLVLTEHDAVARTRLGERELLLDAKGTLFPSDRVLPGDAELPLLRGLTTGGGAVSLNADDQLSLRALAAYTAATGRSVPAGAVIDLGQKDRTVFRLGEHAPTLVLDRDHPEQNLENLVALEERVTRIASGRAIDLRFAHRLTLVPSGTSRSRR